MKLEGRGTEPVGIMESIPRYTNSGESLTLGSDFHFSTDDLDVAC
jgi:hypothetical protein